MSAVFAYVGDVASAAGFRLAGARTFTPAPGEEANALAQARKEADLVLLSSEVAATLPRAALNDALAAMEPVVAIVPGTDGVLPASDPAERVRAQLGLEE